MADGEPQDCRGRISPLLTRYAAQIEAATGWDMQLAFHEKEDRYYLVAEHKGIVSRSGPLTHGETWHLLCGMVAGYQLTIGKMP